MARRIPIGLSEYQGSFVPEDRLMMATNLSDWTHSPTHFTGQIRLVLCGEARR